MTRAERLGLLADGGVGSCAALRIRVTSVDAPG